MDTEKEVSKTFEIVVCLRNAKGELTGRKKSFSSDSANKIWEFWAKHCAGTKHHKKKKGNLPDKKTAENILKTMYNDN